MTVTIDYIQQWEEEEAGEGHRCGFNRPASFGVVTHEAQTGGT